MTDPHGLANAVIEGDERALGRAITRITHRESGYRELVSHMHGHAGDAVVVGITGPPGVGKSTIVDRLIQEYRTRDLAVGVIAIDPVSPFTGGSILGDRIRMGSGSGDAGVFVRSMSTGGSLGGISPATADVITAYDAFGMDRIIVETVGAGQSEVDVVRVADSVCVTLQPGSGDDVQMLKAGVLEIADLFAINKADFAGVDATVERLRAMADHESGEDPPIVETIATSGDGIDELYDHLETHLEQLRESGDLGERRTARYEATIRRILRDEVASRVDRRLEEQGGLAQLAARVDAGETDPYTAAQEVLTSLDGESTGNQSTR